MISTGQTASILPARSLKANFRGGKDYPCEQLQASLVFPDDDSARWQTCTVVKSPSQRRIPEGDALIHGASLILHIFAVGQADAVGVGRLRISAARSQVATISPFWFIVS